MSITYDDIDDPAARPPQEPQEITEVEPGKGKCPDCGKVLTITQAGALRSHTCATDKPRSRGRTSSKTVPESVRKLGVAALAGIAENGATVVVARVIPCERREVPDEITDLPDANVMVGPLIELIWPTLPKSAQAAIKAVADRSDLIACALAWWEYGQTLNAYATAERARRAEHEPGQGVVHGQVSQQVVGGAGNVSPFRPANPAG